jgi:hypothetical protein
VIVRRISHLETTPHPFPSAITPNLLQLNAWAVNEGLQILSLQIEKSVLAFLRAQKVCATIATLIESRKPNHQESRLLRVPRAQLFLPVCTLHRCQPRTGNCISGLFHWGSGLNLRCPYMLVQDAAHNCTLGASGFRVYWSWKRSSKQ